MNALQHILNAAQNVNMAAFDGMTSAQDDDPCPA